MILETFFEDEEKLQNLYFDDENDFSNDGSHCLVCGELAVRTDMRYSCVLWAHAVSSRCNTPEGYTCNFCGKQ